MGDTTTPYEHFVTRFRLSGDIDAAKTLIKTGEREMGKLRQQLGFQSLIQGYRETEPFKGAVINCSVAGTVRLIEIYVAPKGPVEPKEVEERPCFCNCCMAECQIVKVDGTWRSEDHLKVPLPDLGYAYGDRRLRFDVDVCSFLGFSPEAGTMIYEFYRIENVMPSDFTPYQVGDWAMVYFTDQTRETECEKCLNCEPQVDDELGRVWGCIPRDVAETLNKPHCIILPIAIDDRVSRSTVYFRPLASMRLGACIKKAVLDWVQYSQRDSEGRIIGGHANVRWDAWPLTPRGTVVNGIPIRYCTQDFTNADGSHAYRWGNSVYLFMEGETWTVIGRNVAELHTMKNQHVDALPVINPALILLMLWEHLPYDSVPPANFPIDRRGVVYDFTHDTLLDFSKYAWSDIAYTDILPPESINKLLDEYFKRGAGDQAAGSYHYGYPSVSFAMVNAIDLDFIGDYDDYFGQCSSHTHTLALDWGLPVTSGVGVADLYGGVRSDREDGYWAMNPSYHVHHETTSPPYAVNFDIVPDADWVLGEFETSVVPSEWGWSRLKHIDGDAWTAYDIYLERLNSEHLVEMSFAGEWHGDQVSIDGFPSEYSRYWNGFVSKATCNEWFNSTMDVYPSSGPNTTFSAVGTWEYLDIFSGRTSEDFSVFAWEYSFEITRSGVWGDSQDKVLTGSVATGMPGLILACSSSVMFKMVEARFDILNISRAWTTTTAIRDGEPREYVRIEIGGVRSRYDDPFTDGLESTVFDVHNKPSIVSGLTGFVTDAPMVNSSQRDEFLSHHNAGDYGSDEMKPEFDYRRTYQTELQFRAKII